MIHVYTHIDLNLHNSSRKHALNCIIHCRAGKPDSVVDFTWTALKQAQ